MQITILKTENENKGKWNLLHVSFTTDFGKTGKISLASFGQSGEAYKTLANAQSNDVFTVEVAKNDKGYDTWTSAIKAAPGAAKPAASVARSTYETPEERAKKQVYIVRQSSIASAVTALTSGAKAPPKAEDILALARVFESYVFDSGTLVDPAVVLEDVPL